MVYFLVEIVNLLMWNNFNFVLYIILKNDLKCL